MACNTREAVATIPTATCIAITTKSTTITHSTIRPTPFRWKVDIYSDPVLLGRKLKVAEENQTKAAYEVSRVARMATDKLVAQADHMAAEAGSSSDSSDSG